MTPRQRQEMAALVAGLRPGQVWVLIVDKDGTLVPLGDADHFIGNTRAPRTPLRIDGMDVEVTTLETARNQTALAYIVRAALNAGSA
jgi:hypothetical protein